MLVFEERERGGGGGVWNGVPGTRRKLLGAKERTNNKLNPHLASTPGFEPRLLWWVTSALTTAPPSLTPSPSPEEGQLEICRYLIRINKIPFQSFAIFLSTWRCVLNVPLMHLVYKSPGPLVIIGNSVPGLASLGIYHLNILLFFINKQER